MNNKLSTCKKNQTQPVTPLGLLVENGWGYNTQNISKPLLSVNDLFWLKTQKDRSTKNSYRTETTLSPDG